MSRDPLPEPWRSVLERRGIHSKRGLADKAGISPQTAKRLIDGIGRPSVETVQAVADTVFAGDRDYVWRLVGFDVQDHGEFVLPPEASLLDQEQRDAVLAVVRAMLPQDAKRGGSGGDTTAMIGRGPERSTANVLAAQRRARGAGVAEVRPDLAARRGESQGRRLRNSLDAVGEESQDPGDADPA